MTDLVFNDIYLFITHVKYNLRDAMQESDGTLA